MKFWFPLFPPGDFPCYEASMKSLSGLILVAWMAAISIQPDVVAAQPASNAETHAAERTAVTLVSAKGRWTFKVEVARTDAERARGLMFRKSLAADGGMLFISDTQQLVGMWMKNTFIPLDMLFIDRRGRIINIAENAKPQSLDIIRSAGPVVAVLEVAGGTAARLGLRPGDRVLGKFISAE